MLLYTFALKIEVGVLLEVHVHVECVIVKTIGIVFLVQTLYLSFDF